MPQCGPLRAGFNPDQIGILCDPHLHGPGFRLFGPRARIPCDSTPKSVPQGRIRLHPGYFACSRRNRPSSCMQCQSIRSLPFPAAIASAALGCPSALEQGRIRYRFDRYRFRRHELASLLCSKHNLKLTSGSGAGTVGRTYSAESCLPWTCWWN